MDYKKYWEKALDYSSYRENIDKLLEEGKTSGENHSEAMLDYTRMNVQRMKRWDKTFRPNEELITKLQNQKETEYWLVITEAWCGDAAQNIPALVKLAELSGNLELRLVWRDENLELMDAHLTNGVSRSIPILIRLDSNFQPLGQWGPRPVAAQQLFLEHKEKGTEPTKAKEDLHLWYARNKQAELQQELFNW
jgi:hypothetical protein